MGAVTDPSPIARVGHVSLRTTDLDRSLWFWKEVVGLEESERRQDVVYLRAWGEFDHHSLALTADADAGVDHIAWRVRREADVDATARDLEARGLDLDWVEPDSEAGQGRAFRFQAPAGHEFEIYHDMERTLPTTESRSRLKTNCSRARNQGISPRRIDHVNVTALDPAATCDWLTEVFGFQARELIRTEEDPAAIWMGVSALSHDIAVMRDAEGASARFHHLGYYLDDAHDVLRAADVLRESGVEIDGGPGRHGVSQAIYLYARDPGSGHRLELFSGGYLVLDPDWPTVEWSPEELSTAMCWWGPNIAELPAMDLTTPYRGAGRGVATAR